jgi:hypothetical protein
MPEPLSTADSIQPAEPEKIRFQPRRHEKDGFVDVAIIQHRRDRLFPSSD